MRIHALFVLLCLADAARGQAPATPQPPTPILPARPDAVGDLPIRYCIPEMECVTVRRDLIYKPGTSTAPARRFDLYLPPETTDDRRLPVVLFVNGVGLPGLKETAVYSSWARAAAAHGLAAVAFDVDPGSVEADIDLLVSHLKFNAEGLPVDGENMCWWACGRNVDRSLPLALQEDRTYLKCIVVYYGMPTYIPKLRGGLPILLVKGGRDDMRLNHRIDSFAMDAASKNRDLTYIVYPDGEQAFDVFDGSTRTRAIIQETLDFMTLHLSPALQLETRISGLIRQGYASWKDNQWTECARTYRQVLALDDEVGHAHFMIGLAELYLGNYEESVRRFEASVALGFRCRESTYNIACAYAKWGKTDVAFEYLYEARERGFDKLTLLKDDPDLDSLRGDARFAELLKRWDAPR